MLVLVCSPLPTVAAFTVIPGWLTTTVPVAFGVATTPGAVTLTVVVPDDNGWNATPPDVVSNGVSYRPSAICAVCVVAAGVAAFSRLPTVPGVVNVTVSGP